MAVKLSAKWQLDAALLSRPVDLTALVTMSRSSPEKFTEDNTLHRLVAALLNEKNDKKSDKDTKLDVLNILANVATGSKAAVAEARTALQGVSEWFDEYMAQEETTGGQEPELNKAMVLLLARCWEYRLKTEDVLELTQGNRKIALCTVVGLLEDGETYSTELKQRQKPEQGKMGQWEHELVVHRYEKPLLLQICRLLRGFTHPGTYFDSSTEEIALFSVERFAEEMDTLLEITLRSQLVEKLSMALYDCLFEEEEREEEPECKSQANSDGTLTEYDHVAVAAVHAFLQNLYFYATEHIEEYRRHMLMETLLIPRLVLPYLDRCVIHATILNTRAEAYADMLEGDCVAEMALHNPQLVKGIAASLRTLIIASFRAPSTQFVMTLLRRLNPTAQILRASAFCRHHEYIFALLCMLNVNMSALNISKKSGLAEESDDIYATQLLSQLAGIYNSMDSERRARVSKRVMFSGALPISRDTESYTAVMSVLDGGAAGQLEYAVAGGAGAFNPAATTGYNDHSEFLDSRAEAKRASAERMQHLRQVDEHRGRSSMDNSDTATGSAPSAAADGKQSAFQIAVSVAHASEHKDAKSTGRAEHKQAPSGSDCKDAEPSENAKYRLLGDLPSLAGDNRKATAAVALSLALHSNEANPAAHKGAFMKGADSKADGPGGDASKSGSENIPKEFLCAINGHVMKEPVKARTSGLVFEQSTIELWLGTRGSVCPISNTPLEKGDLLPDDELRNRIKRYHIQQTALRRQIEAEDDLYDF